MQAIDRMIDEDVPCEDALAQINAAKSALHGCGKVVLEGHIKHCVRDCLEHGAPDQTIASLTKAIERFANMGSSQQPPVQSCTGGFLCPLLTATSRGANVSVHPRFYTFPLHP